MDKAIDSWVGKLGGRFVVFDGPDGSGKSTQFRRFADAARSAGLSVCEVREPGGTPIGESIRKVLLDYRDDEQGRMDLRCEMLLFMASRAQLIRQRLMPALAEGQLVLADRFVSSTLAYQGAGGGLPISQIQEVARLALGECRPDLVVIFDVDQRTASRRLNPLLSPGPEQRPVSDENAQANASEAGPANLDRLESRSAEFHRKVRQGYLDQAAANPEGHLVVDAAGEPEVVWRRLVEGLGRKLS